MDILGIGGWELVAILIIMLVVAGPKRMIQWSYTLGKYVAMLRKMWGETAQMLQKEFDEAGVDVQVPKDIPTRSTINREINRALSPVTKPLQETLDATKQEIDGAKQAMSLTPKTNGETKPTATDAAKPAAPATPPETEEPTPPAEANSAAESQPVPSSNGRPAGDFGTWSQKSDSEA